MATTTGGHRGASSRWPRRDVAYFCSISIPCGTPSTRCKHRSGAHKRRNGLCTYAGTRGRGGVMGGVPLRTSAGRSPRLAAMARMLLLIVDAVHLRRGVHARSVGERVTGGMQGARGPRNKMIESAKGCRMSRHRPCAT